MKLRGTTATYRNNGDHVCDLVELAEAYRHLGKIPERIGLARACEIRLLADAFLQLYKPKKGKEKGPHER